MKSGENGLRLFGKLEGINFIHNCFQKE